MFFFAKRRLAFNGIHSHVTKKNGILPNHRCENLRIGIEEGDATYLFILHRVEPLLCDDRDTDEYPRDVSKQRLSRHVPAATNRRPKIQVLLETGYFYVVRAEELS
jgi:hypothetical protein